MNERIRELADKASQWVIDNSNGVHAPYERWNEKFAELLIQECVYACSKAKKIKHVIPPTREIVVDCCMREIKEHFGVEE
jgi:predicted P-loop ATPase/GTPase